MTGRTDANTPPATPLATAEHALLEEAGLSHADLDQALGRLLVGSVDAADLYFQRSRSESWVLEDGIVKSGRFDLDQGVGVRAMSGDKTGFAYSDAIQQPALLTACGSARAIVRAGQSGRGKPLSAEKSKPLYSDTTPTAAWRPRKSIY